ncbi:MAG: MBL fold metallo-hydrolase [Planctomycetes bacterium]|nr:MBL fold metallo-hydrolase [Planctomycetota bacterium]
MTDSLEIKPSDPARLSLTVVYDNHPGADGLESAWGFSCLVAGLERPILFDTGGDAGVLRSNMARLKIDPGEIRDVMISHAHWDHVTGIELFRSLPRGFRVFVPKPFSEELKKKITDAGGAVQELSEPQEILPGAYSTGSMGLWIKEQALLIPTTAGAVIVTGCAHPGPVAIVKRTLKELGQEVFLLAGGFHLMDAGRAKITKQITRLQGLGVRHVAPGHCSGDRARTAFREAFLDRYQDCHVGRRLDLKDLSLWNPDGNRP